MVVRNRDGWIGETGRLALTATAATTAVIGWRYFIVSHQLLAAVTLVPVCVCVLVAYLRFGMSIDSYMGMLCRDPVAVVVAASSELRRLVRVGRNEDIRYMLAPVADELPALPIVSDM